MRQLLCLTLQEVNLAGVNLARAKLYGADLEGTALGGADLRNVRGLTVEQVLASRPTSLTRLPAQLADDPRVRQRIIEVEAEEAQPGRMR
jgi:uncharacterized protein YjbI with pentapeptide repeats